MSSQQRNSWLRLLGSYLFIFIVFWLALVGLGGSVGPLELLLGYVLLMAALTAITIRFFKRARQ